MYATLRLLGDAAFRCAVLRSARLRFAKLGFARLRWEGEWASAHSPFFYQEIRG